MASRKNTTTAPAKKKPAPSQPPTKAYLPHFSMLQEEKDFTRWLSKEIAVLDYFAGNAEKVPRELWITLETLRIKKGEELFVELIYALTHKYFPPPDAKILWEGIVAHKKALEKKIKREVGMKVAVLDYLYNQSGKIKDLQLLPAEDLDSLLLYANEDGLTSLYNHRYFQERLRYEVVRCQRYHHPFSLLLLDLDHFKDYNDYYGHLKGDILLREIANFFKTSCRQADVVARYGGDEFALILPETDHRQAMALALRLQSAFAVKQFGSPLPGISSWITVSIGMACFPRDGNNAAALIEGADRALYYAKRAGRNCIRQGKKHSRGRPVSR